MAIDIEAPGANEADLQRALSNLLEFRGAKARMTSDDTTQNVTSEPSASFDVADFDTDGFWSAGTPNRLTIPSSKGITYVEAYGQAYLSSSTADTWAGLSIVHLNSSNTVLRSFGARFIEGGTTNRIMAVATGPVAVSDGDYFQLRPREESDTSITIEGDQTGETFLSIKVVGMNPV